MREELKEGKDIIESVKSEKETKEEKSTSDELLNIIKQHETRKGNVVFDSFGM